MKRKIVLVGPAYPLRGGIANFNEALAQHWADNGFEVHVFSFSLQYPNWLFPGKTQIDESAQPPSNYTIHNTINSINPFTWWSTAKAIAKLRPAWVVFRFWMPFFGPSLGSIAKRLKRLKVPLIAITDNVIPHERRPGDRWLTQRFLRHMDGFVAMSRAVLEDLKTFDIHQPSKFLPHPVYNIFGDKVSRETAIAKLGLDPQTRYLLFFGIVRTYKGLDLLLKAFSMTQAENVKLIIAGEFYDDKSIYLNQIQTLGIENDVLIHDHYIPMDLVSHYFCASDLVTQTYQTATQSGVTQIAYHFEIPMLVTNVGGLSEIVPHQKAGYVCEKSPEEIAHCIDDFFEQNRYGEMADFVKVEKEKYSWDHFAIETENLINEIKNEG